MDGGRSSFCDCRVGYYEMITIHRDFVDWPLETFLDAYKFKRVGQPGAGDDYDGWAANDCHDVRRYPIRAEVIYRDGRAAEGMLDQMDLIDAIAYRAIEFDGPVAICCHCGDHGLEDRFQWLDDMGGLMCDGCYGESE